MAHGNEPAKITTPKFFGNRNAPEAEVIAPPVPEEPTIQAEAPQSAILETPAPKAPKKKKAERATTPLRPKGKSVDRHCRITFFTTQEESDKIMFAKIRLHKPVSDIARESTLDYLQNTYMCSQCNTSFTIVSESDGTHQTPSCCPCCQNTDLLHIVVS